MSDKSVRTIENYVAQRRVEKKVEVRRIKEDRLAALRESLERGWTTTHDRMLVRDKIAQLEKELAEVGQ